MEETAFWGFWKYSGFPLITADTRRRDRLLRVAMPQRQKHKHEGVGLHI